MFLKHLIELAYIYSRKMTFKHIWRNAKIVNYNSTGDILKNKFFLTQTVKF